MVDPALAMRHAAVLERTSEAICLVDPSGRIAFANPAVAALVGAATEDVIGTRAMAWVHPEDRAALRRIIRGWSRGEAAETNLDVRLRHRSGRWQDTEARLDDATDDPVLRGVIVGFRDITGRRAAQRRRMRVLETVETLTGASSLAEAFQVFNVAACDVAWHEQAIFAVRQGDDYRVVTAIGIDLADNLLVPRADPVVKLLEGAEGLVVGALPHVEGIARKLAEAGTRTYAAHAVRARGDVIAMIALGSYHDDAFADVDLELLESMVLHAASALRTFRALEIERAKAVRFGEFARVRQLFLEMAAHDVRTPLSVIRGLSETLETHWDRLSDTMKVHLADRVRHNAVNLTTMVTRMLETSDIMSPTDDLRPETLDLLAVVEAVASDLAMTTGRDIPVTASTRVPAVHADRIRMAEVVANLVQNALTYSPAPEPVAVDLRVERGDVVVSVRDNGAGIPREEQDAIFQRLTRLADTTDRGFGLGLYISRLIVEAHGGRIWVESTPGEGSTFSFTVPLEPAPRFIDQREMLSDVPSADGG